MQPTRNIVISAESKGEYYQALIDKKTEYEELKIQDLTEGNLMPKDLLEYYINTPEKGTVKRNIEEEI